METSPPINFIYEKLTEKDINVSPQELEERQLALLVESAGWKILKKRIEDSIENLKELTGIDAKEMQNLELVGFKFLATRVAMSKLQEIIDLVDYNAQVQADRLSQEEGDRK